MAKAYDKYIIQAFNKLWHIKIKKVFIIGYLSIGKLLLATQIYFIVIVAKLQAR